jgi:predicted nicotinamide N-methyase
LLTSQHPDIRRLKRASETPSIHGNKTWGSSFLIMDYLKKHPLPAGSRVLELGCGWGPAGIFCAKQFGAEVTGVDADSAVFPYLELHARENGVAIATHCARFEKLTTGMLGQYDVIIGADICFWDELAVVLKNLVNRAVRAGVKQILLADPGRPPFLDLADYCVDKHCAEFLAWSTTRPRRSTGCLISIQNA